MEEDKMNITKEDIDNIIRALNNGANKEHITDMLLDIRNELQQGDK